MSFVPAKRFVVGKACEGCRRRKIKCDAATTNSWPCTACIRLRLKCVPPTGSYEKDYNGSQTFDLKDQSNYQRISSAPAPKHPSRAFEESSRSVPIGRSLKNHNSPEDPARQDLDEWRRALFLTDPYVDRECIITKQDTRFSGTYNWIRQDNRYRAWLNSDNCSDGDHNSKDNCGSGLLRISSVRRTGNGMLSVFLTEELEKHVATRPDTEVVFFFCNAYDSRRNTCAAMLCGLIYQIGKKFPNRRRYIDPYLGTLKTIEQAQSSLDTLWDIFSKLVSAANLGTIFCVIDGLDECEKSTLDVLLPRLMALFENEALSSGKGTFKLAIINSYIPGLEDYTQIRLEEEMMTGDTDPSLSALRGSFIQDQNDWSRFLNATDDNSDRDSVVPYAESIWSKTSAKSAATGFTAPSGYSAMKIETATKELSRIFLQPEHLIKYYESAYKQPHIGPERLERNIRRLLKVFATDLQADANTELEKLAARLVSLKATYVARCVIDKFELHRKPVSAQKSQTIIVPQKGDKISVREREDEHYEEREKEEEEEDPEDHADQDLIEDLSAFREFLTNGTAFASFQSRLEAFVLAKPVEMKNSERKEKQVPNKVSDPATQVDQSLNLGEGSFQTQHRRTLLGRSQMALESLFIAAGFLEPPLYPGMVRIRWQCRCGENFFGDVVEYRDDGIKVLTEKMRRSTGATVTITPYSKTSTNQKWSFKVPAWAQRVLGGPSSTKAGNSNLSGGLPQHNDPNHSPPETSSSVTTDTPAPLNPTLHLLACTHRSERRKCLLQDPIDSVSTDRALFCFMKQQIQRSRNRIRSILAMRSVQGMFFVKFRLRMGNIVEVRDHNPCCISTNPTTCECIPPAPKVEPAPNAEYRCSPAGPLATWPPVLSQDLMHMLSSPQCINEDETWVLDQLPKRTIGELQACAGQPAEGWGVYYKEGIDFDMIIGVVFVVFVIASLLFGILWTRLEMDIQGAFGVSSYMVTASGIFLAWMGSRAKNFG